MAAGAEQFTGREPGQEVLLRSLSLAQVITALEHYSFDLTGPKYGEVTTAENLRLLQDLVHRGMAGFEMLDDVEELRDLSVLGAVDKIELATEIVPDLRKIGDKILDAYRVDATVRIIQINSFLKAHPELVKLHIIELGLDVNIIELRQVGLNDSTFDHPTEPTYFFMTAAGDYGLMYEDIALLKIDSNQLTGEDRVAIERYRERWADEHAPSAIMNAEKGA